MKTEVTRLSINNEMDVVLAHRRAMQIARFSGISLSEQTRFATAVSEICRNCLEYADGGDIIFSVLKKDEKYLVEAEVIDKGNGITNLTKILSRDPHQYKGRGLGIVYARRLSDDFEIKSGAKGTIVRIRKYFVSKNNLVSKLIIEGWKKHLLDEPPLSAYEELKIRNLQLLELTEEMREQIEKLDHQFEEIARLNHRIQNSNKNMQ
jgi:anti-sigma regulatory factor (Ser/Thr protein kinase)